jgi:hypothetical protein
MANAPAPQERTALSEPRVGAYTEKQLSEVRRHHADTPCVITGTHETCRLLATVNEREEALQRVLAVCAEYEGPKKVAKARCGCRTWVTTDEIRAALPILREAASVEPSDEEVAEVWRVSSPPDARVYSEGARDRMRAALSAFLSARKQGET